MAVSDTKVCTTCKVEKPVSDFGFRRAGQPALRHWCFSCNRASNNLRYASGLGRIRAMERVLREEKTPSIRQRIDSASVFDERTGCQMWTGASRNGYPRMKFKGATVAAHRSSLLDSLGLESTDLQVLHRCDTPLCVNPDHLFLGTHADNMADKASKGRSPKTVTRTDQETRNRIIKMFLDGFTKRRISREVNFSTKTVQIVISKYQERK